MWVLFPWSHQATRPIRLDTSAYLWFGWIISSTPRAPHAMPVRALYRPRTGIFNVFHILRDLYGARCDLQGCRTAPLRTCKGIDTTMIGKNPAQASYLAVWGLYGLLLSLHRLIMGCLRSQSPYRARKLIMQTSKLYRHRTGRQNWYGATQDPCGPREWMYDFCSKQPGNSPYGARVRDVTEALPGFQWVIYKDRVSGKIAPAMATIDALFVYISNNM